MRLLLVLAAACCLSAAAAAPLSTPLSGEVPACPCHDVDPRSEFWMPWIEGQDIGCFEQAMKGGCGQPFFKTAIAEVGEFCQISCGSCPCCEVLLAVAAKIGGGEFAWAFNATDPSLRVEAAPLMQPGFMATVLVPPDGAMRAAIDRLGGRGAIASDARARGELTKIVAAHILRPNAEYNAPWTSPFLKRAVGSVLPTFADGVSLKVVSADDKGGVAFAPVLANGDAGGASSSSARMAAGGSGRLDLEACKGTVVGVDQVIVP